MDEKTARTMRIRGQLHEAGAYTCLRPAIKALQGYCRRVQWGAIGVGRIPEDRGKFHFQARFIE